MLKNIPKEELEILSYTDLTELILKEKNKPLNTPGIFKIICELLDYSDSEFTDKIGDFYTSLTTDKRFVFLESNEWDLRENHSVELVVDDDDADLSEEPLEDEEVEEENEENEDNIDADLDDADDDLDDLTIIDDDETEE